MQRSADKRLQPWTILGSETVLDTPWFRINKYACLTPSGRTIPGYYVHETEDSVMCAAVTSDGLVIMERQYRLPVRGISMDFPAGAVKSEDNDLEGAALRELWEETGYVAGEATHLFTLVKDPGFSASLMHVFYAENVRFDPENKWVGQADEPVAVELLTPSELLCAVDDGRVSCALCVATTYRLARIFGWVKG